MPPESSQDTAHGRESHPACGESSARAFARIANDQRLREQLKARGIVIPDDTYFVGGRHGPSSARIVLFDVEQLPSSHQSALFVAKGTVNEARSRTARECSRSLPVAERRSYASPDVSGRVVPLAPCQHELSHAGNALAIVGRRELTRSLFLDRRAFVLSYDAAGDADGRILERTLLAAVPRIGESPSVLLCLRQQRGSARYAPVECQPQRIRGDIPDECARPADGAATRPERGP